MWLRKIGRPALSVLAVAALLFVYVPSAGAASSGGNGLRISPVRSDFVIEPGKSQTVTINVTNVTSTPATLQTIVNDFTASKDESGNPAIILDSTQFASSHSLKRFVGPVTKFALQPGESKQVAITINIPKDAAGGGYFGAVRFAPATSVNGPNETVNLAGSVGSLILVKVPGDIKEQVTIASFDARKKDHASSFFTSGKGIAATVRMQNEGNIQEAPFGKIILKNSKGKTLGTYELNNVTPAANVLPDSIRKFSIPLKDVGGFGKYRLEGNFGYGSTGQLLSAGTTFYVIPKALIYIFIAIVLLLLFIVFALPKLIRRYNDFIVRRAARTLGRRK